jgi:hypothetical protein
MKRCRPFLALLALAAAAIAAASPTDETAVSGTALMG